MGKICLAIADTDADYVRSLENYILVNYSERFDICSFTDPEAADISGRTGRTVDILLLDSKFDTRKFDMASFDTVVKLAENCPAAGDDDSKVLDKFQHAEKIIGDILSIFSQKPNAEKLPSGRKKTLIVTVFSPSGGCGKTSIAVCSSIICAERCIKAFFLNLESLPSTMLYFNGRSEQNFSKIIYYLKEKDKNMPVRLEGARCVDPETGVYYFLPPDNPAEMNELLPEDLDLLVEGFRELSAFDIVFIDLPGGFDKRTIALLKASDIVLTVCRPDIASIFKMEQLLPEMDVIDRKYSIDLSRKTIFILNGITEEAPGSGYTILGYNNGSMVHIKESKALRDLATTGRLTDVDPAFTSSISQLVDMIIQNRFIDRTC